MTISARNPNVYVTKSAVNYDVSIFDDGCTISYVPNGAQIAAVALDNTDGALDSTFSLEDNVQLYIDQGSGGVKMIDGYIFNITSKYSVNPFGRKIKLLKIADFGGYLAPKTKYVHHYWKATAGHTVLSNAAAAISGVTASAVSSSITSTVKSNFLGTQVSDVLKYVCDLSGADWFFDESKDLNAFPHASLPLQLSGSTYGIMDSPNSAHAYELGIRLKDGFSWEEDSTYQFRSVEVTNGSEEVFPHEPDAWVTSMRMNTIIGDSYPTNIFGIASAARDATTGVVSHLPKIVAGPAIDAGGKTTIPAMQFKIEGTGDIAHFILKLFNATGSSTYSTDIGALNLSLPLGAYDEIWFYLYPGLSADPTYILMRLVDSSSGHYYYRDILGDNRGRNLWSFHAYSLPVSGNTSNGWTKDVNGATVTNIDTVEWYFFKTGMGISAIDADSAGWAANDTMKIARPLFYRIHGQTVTGAGSPATIKVIQNKNLTDDTSLLNYATAEQARCSVPNSAGSCNINGNTDFKRPGYTVTVNMANTLNKSGTVRLDRIDHVIKGGQYITKLAWSNAFWRL